MKFKQMFTAVTIILVLIIAVVFIFKLEQVAHQRGYYNPLTKSITCSNRDQCLHEIGHAIDHAGGWVSRNEAYHSALELYIWVNWKTPESLRDPLADQIIVFPGLLFPKDKENNPFVPAFWTGGWGGIGELYADMLRWTNGEQENMPMVFRSFYNWELIEKLIEKYIIDVVNKDGEVK